MPKHKEQRANIKLLAAAMGRVKLHRVENQVLDGMPDLVGINRCSVSFWIESKALDRWPALESTKPLRCAFEPGQIPFLKAWRSYGGNAFVCLRVSREGFFLLTPTVRSWKFDGEKELVDLTRSEIESCCVASGGADEIITFLEQL